jgi:hypothetical protein
MRAILFAAAAVLAAGCAAEFPARQLARTEAAVRAADDVGAEEIPRAAAYLKMAEDSLELARSYMATDEMDAALAALDRSRYDAEIALAIAREEETRAKARQARKAVEVLRTNATADQPDL